MEKVNYSITDTLEIKSQIELAEMTKGGLCIQFVFTHKTLVQ